MDFETDFTGSFEESENTFTGEMTQPKTIVIGGIEYEQDKVQGVSGAHTDSIEKVREAIRSQSQQDREMRKMHTKNFQWTGTVIAVKKTTVKTYKDGSTRTVLDSPKFLCWRVNTVDSAGGDEYMTHDALLSYISQKCDDTGKIGEGSTGLILSLTGRKLKGEKQKAKYDVKPIFSLKPQIKNFSKYDDSKLIEAKRPAYNDDGTPKTKLKPKAEKGSQNPDDYYQEMEFTEEFKFLKTRTTQKELKAEREAADAAEMLKFLYGM